MHAKRSTIAIIVCLHDQLHGHPCVLQPKVAVINVAHGNINDSNNNNENDSNNCFVCSVVSCQGHHHITDS